jgi:hypothetical protein
MSNEVAARIWAEIGGWPPIVLVLVLVLVLDDQSLSVAAQQRLAFPALKNVEDDDEGEYDLEASRDPTALPVSRAPVEAGLVPC